MPIIKRFAIGCLLFVSLSLGLAATPGTLVELGPVEFTPVRDLTKDYFAKLRRDLATRADDYRILGPMAVFQQMFQEHVASLVPSVRVQYASRDAMNRPRTYSGRVFMPSHTPGTPPMEVPLVIYQHATETRRKATPYYNKGDETLLGALAAELCGFVVAMPDGDGMGADPSPYMHAYCQGKTTATCLIDLIRAAQDRLDGRAIFDDVNYVWDGEVYIVGYSEGGYIAMAAVKELASNPEYKDIRLSGAACMGGPFNFGKALRDLLKDPKTPYDRPYIPAYFLAAWQDIYPNEVSLKAAMNPELLKSDASGTAAQWLKGDLGGDQIAALIQARLTGDKAKEVPARAILNEGWVKANIDGPSRLNKLFDQNSLVGGWKPKSPVLLVHDPYDKTVGFESTKAIHDDWVRQKINPIGIVELSLLGKGTGHVGGAVVAIPTAFIWIAADMPKSVMAMAKDKLAKAIKDAAPESLKPNAEALADATGLKEANENLALLPLSRIENKGGPYKLSFGDRFLVLGKIKLYAIEKKPVYPRQNITAGTGGYTRLVKQLKYLKDTFEIPANSTYYMAVYPQKGGVALTLKFEGGGAGKSVYTTNIKQVKNKVVGRDTGANFSVSANFKERVEKTSYDRPGQPKA
ncbi:MAG: lipase family protein, partial [Holophaga sp.]|nr:lipase family protein [Holophaga sp.]